MAAGREEAYLESADSTPRMHVHDLVQVFDDDDTENDMSLEEGENWLRLVDRSHTAGNSALDNTQDMTPERARLPYPVLLQLGSIDAPTEDCFLCLDVDGPYVALKDMRNPFASNADEGEESLEIFLARKSGKAEIPVSRRTDVDLKFPDDKETGNHPAMWRNYAAFETLPRRQLRVLHSGDRICTRLPTSGGTDRAVGLVLEYRYSDKHDDFDPGSVAVDAQDSDDEQEDEVALTQPVSEEEDVDNSQTDIETENEESQILLKKQQSVAPVDYTSIVRSSKNGSSPLNSQTTNPIIKQNPTIQDIDTETSTGSPFEVLRKAAHALSHVRSERNDPVIDAAAQNETSMYAKPVINELVKEMIDNSTLPIIASGRNSNGSNRESSDEAMKTLPLLTTQPSNNDNKMDSDDETTLGQPDSEMVSVENETPVQKTERVRNVGDPDNRTHNVPDSQACSLDAPTQDEMHALPPCEHENKGRRTISTKQVGSCGEGRERHSISSATAQPAKQQQGVSPFKRSGDCLLRNNGPSHSKLVRNTSLEGSIAKHGSDETDLSGVVTTRLSTTLRPGKTNQSDDLLLQTVGIVESTIFEVSGKPKDSIPCKPNAPAKHGSDESNPSGGVKTPLVALLRQGKTNESYDLSARNVRTVESTRCEVGSKPKDSIPCKPKVSSVEATESAGQLSPLLALDTGLTSGHNTYTSAIVKADSQNATDATMHAIDEKRAVALGMPRTKENKVEYLGDKEAATNAYAKDSTPDAYDDDSEKTVAMHVMKKRQDFVENHSCRKSDVLEEVIEAKAFNPKSNVANDVMPGASSCEVANKEVVLQTVINVGNTTLDSKILPPKRNPSKAQPANSSKKRKARQLKSSEKVEVPNHDAISHTQNAEPVSALEQQRAVASSEVSESVEPIKPETSSQESSSKTRSKRRQSAENQPSPKRARVRSPASQQPSPKRTPGRSDLAKIRVVVTNVHLTPSQRKMIERIGGVLLEDVQETTFATHVIAAEGKSETKEDEEPSFKRTSKLMIGLCCTENVVHLDWLIKSAKARKALAVHEFLLLKDRAAEKRYNFNMRETLRRRKEMRINQTKLFGGWGVYVCQGVANNKAPPEHELRLIVEAAGGEWLVSPVVEEGDVDDKLDFEHILIITSDPETKKQITSKPVALALKKGAKKFPVSWLFDCIMAQFLAIN